MLPSHTKTSVALAFLLGATPGNATDIAYVWGDKPSASDYQAAASYTKRPEAGQVQIRRSGTGVYTVNVGNILSRSGGNIGVDPVNVGHVLLQSSANIQVTAYGTDDHRCKIRDWGLGSATVLCFDRTGRH